MDTLAIARDLRGADLTQAQAEAIASAIGRSVVENSATKSDLENLRLALKGEIDGLQASTKSDLENLRLALKGEIDGLQASTKSDLEALRLSLKGEIDGLRTSTRGEIDGLRASTKGDLEALRGQLLTWFIATQVAVGALIIAIVKL
jgi:hypothetical protein